MDAADWRSRFLEEGLHAVVSSRLQRGYLAESCVAESFYGEFDRAIQRRHLPLRGAHWQHAVVEILLFIAENVWIPQIAVNLDRRFRLQPFIPSRSPRHCVRLTPLPVNLGALLLKAAGLVGTRENES